MFSLSVLERQLMVNFNNIMSINTSNNVEALRDEEEYEMILFV